MTDILYSIKYSGNDGVFQRLKCSVDSILNNTDKDSTICIADTSVDSLEDKLKEILGIQFKYIHKPNYGIYNKSYNINVGVKNLITSEKFIMSDVDVVYQKDHIARSKLMPYDLIVSVVHRIKPGIVSSDFYELIRHGILSTELIGGNCYCSKKLFYSLNGFDEQYVGYGAEDDDFYLRAMRKTKVYYAKTQGFDKSFTIAHLWHEKMLGEDPNFMTYLDMNRARLAGVQQKLANGQLRFHSVNPNGWGL
jgi:hypothetical protein